MVNSWWLIAEAAGFLALMLYMRGVNYRCGIWDGAFNHFLPVVQKEMRFYDARRAEEILGKLDDKGLPVWEGRCGICGKLPCDFHGHYPVPEGEA